jgi:hypothetical protein
MTNGIATGVIDSIHRGIKGNSPAKIFRAFGAGEEQKNQKTEVQS